MIQVRDVPDQVHRTLKARAARQGISLSDYLKNELQRIAELPSIEEWVERTASMRPIATQRTSAQLVRELRDAG